MLLVGHTLLYLAPLDNSFTTNAESTSVVALMASQDLNPEALLFISL